MDTQRGKISFLSAASILFLSSGMMIHVLVMPIILETAGRDAWISVLIGAPFYLLMIIFLKKFIARLNGQSLIDWLKQKWGRVGYSIFVIIIFSLLYFYSLHTLIDTNLWTVSTYLQATPILVISGCLLIISLIVALQGIQSLAVTSAILLPIVTFFGFFVASSNEKYKDYSLLLPILEQGLVPPLHGSFYVFSALSDSLLLLFIAHDIKTKITYKKMIGFGLFLIMIFIGPLIGGITEFGVLESTAQRYTVFDQWKILSVGKLLQHLDFLSIFQWLSGSFIRISMSFYIMTQLINIKSKGQKTTFFIVIFVTMLIISIRNWNSDAMLSVLKSYYFPIVFVVNLSLTLAFFVTLLISRSKGRTPSNTIQQNTEVGETDEPDTG